MTQSGTNQRMSESSPIFADIMAIADTCEPLPSGWWNNYLKRMRKPWEDAYAEGRVRKEQLQFYDCEAYGHNCPICKTAPDVKEAEIIIDGKKIGEYQYWKISCDCERTFEDRIRIELELKERILDAEIPDDYLSISWQDWDITVNPALSAAFRKVQGYSFGDNLNGLLRDGLVLFGEVGRGKTMAAICLMQSILENTNKNCKYISMADFARNILRSGEKGDYLDRIEKYDVLLLDDIDKLKAESAWIQERIFSLFEMMFRKNKCLIVTTNKLNFSELQEHFGNHGEAIVSRMSGRMLFSTFTGGEDFRKRRRIQELKAEKAGKAG